MHVWHNLVSIYAHVSRDPCLCGHSPGVPGTYGFGVLGWRRPRLCKVFPICADLRKSAVWFFLVKNNFQTGWKSGPLGPR
jgi:hypothetical protein